MGLTNTNRGWTLLRSSEQLDFENSGVHRRSLPSSDYTFLRLSSGIALLVVMVGLVSCGAGGGGTTQSQQDFTLSISPSSLSLQQLGNGVTLTVSVIPVNGFGGGVTLTFPNPPAGISVAAVGSSSGPPFIASPTIPVTLGVSASQAAAVGNGVITVQGISGSLTHSTTINTSVAAAIVFQLEVSPSTITIGPNGRASAQVTLVPGSNFGSNSVFLTYPSGHVGNTGVDMNLSSEFLTAAQTQATVSFQSSFEVEPGSFSAPLTGTLGAQVINLPLTLSIVNPAKACTVLPRSTVRRTDMDTTGVVYDPVHKLVFAAVQQTNTLQVFSSTTAQTVATISIPAPRHLDITPDGSRILVGTLTNYMYWVDPVTLQVVGKVPAGSSLFNNGSPQLLRPVILASGKVLVALGDGAPDEWDPATNLWSNPTPPSFTPGDAVIRRSADHSKVVVATINENTLAIFDSATDSYGPVQNITTSAAALSSNGSKLAVLGASPDIPGGAQVILFDQNFNILATYQLNSQVLPTDLIFSWDDSMVFLQEGLFVTALSASDLSFVGQIPSPGSGGVDYPSDIDETNMIFSPGTLGRTTIFTDASAPCALGVNLPFNIALAPPQGTVTAPSAVTLNAAGITAQSQVYFGAAPGSPQATPGTNLVLSPPTSIQVTPPSSQSTSAVNVTLTNPDGSTGIAPDGFSYGSNVLAVVTNSGPAAGGTSVTIYGYGLAFDQSEIQVTIGGQAATVTQATPGAGISPFPFPMNQVTFTTPPGNPGPADIVITTPAGSATVAGGFHYLQSAQNYGISSTLTEAVYDQLRQRVYVADGGSNVVDVFDLAKQAFVAPIQVGSAPQALAITPDFNTLVVSNGAEGTISIVDLTDLNATKTVSVISLPNLPSQCGQPIPYAVATTSSNKAVIALECPNVTAGEYVVLDLATQAIGCGASQGCTAMMAAFPQNLDYVLAVSGTTDGSLILVSNGGTIGLWNVNADTFTSQFSGGGLFEFPVVQTASASDGTAFAQVYWIYDPTLYQGSILQDVDYLQSGINDVNSVPGEKLHPSAALLYYPENNGISIYDVHQGHLKRRVALTQQTASTFDAMAIDETGSQVFLITTNGLTVMNIADLPLSIGNLQPAYGSASGGTSVRIRGSGFQSGAQVLFNNTAASAQFIDASTLQATSPALPAGAVRITVVNPNGSQYSLDDAFTAQ